MARYILDSSHLMPDLYATIDQFCLISKVDPQHQVATTGLSVRNQIANEVFSQALAAISMGFDPENISTTILSFPNIPVIDYSRDGFPFHSQLGSAVIENFRAFLLCLHGTIQTDLPPPEPSTVYLLEGLSPTYMIISTVIDAEVL